MGIGQRLAAAAAVTACVLPAAELAAIPAAHASAPAAGPTGIVAAAGELVNVATASRMWSREQNTELPMASITKVMTAMVVLSQGDLNRKITVTAAAVRHAQDNSADSTGLRAGDVLTGSQLLEGMLLHSGADAAYLLAQSYGSGWPAFVRKMNATARHLGMTQTGFANFDGLPWPTAYSNHSTPQT
jgi:D-alanyl-D-alanine carboxypeptidase (penicillin-binding protein 5/6)